MPSPPPVFRLVLGIFAGRRFRRSVLDDLQEEFEDQVVARGRRAARRWYRLQVLLSLVPLLRWRLARRQAPWRRALRALGWSAPGQDLKYAFRSLKGAPGFSLVVILTLALGIGVNTAAFSLVHSLILEPLPFPGGDRMVQLWRYEEMEGGSRSLTPPVAPQVAAWREDAGTFEAMGGFVEEEFHLATADAPISVMGARVSPEIFSMVSARPLVGRLFDSQDGAPGGGNVLLLSEEVWAGRFGSDPGILDGTVLIDGEPHRVVGVVPRGLRTILEAGFFGSQPKEILLPLPTAPGGGWAGSPNVVARLGAGETAASAQERLDGIQPRVAPLMEGHSEWQPLVLTARDALAPGLRRGLWVLFGAVALVLLIACANVATLLLVRSLARGEEMKVRLALGAGRSRLAGQVGTESLLLGASGLVLAIFAAGWILDAAIAMAGQALPEIRASRLDPEAFGFALAAGFATVFLFGLIPLFHLAGLTPAGVMTRAGHPSTSRPPGWKAHRVLVVGQVALATVLLLSAGLLGNTLGRLLSVDAGLDVKGLAAVGLELPRARYEVGRERIALFDEVVRGLEGRPGVEAVGWARFVPPRVAGAPGTIQVEGRPVSEERSFEAHAGNWVSPTYFRAAGVSFLAGRPFTDSEIAHAEEVVILNRSAAGRLWPDGEGGVGSRIRLDSDFGPSPWMTVVGIVPDYKAWWLGDAPDRTQVYLPVSNVPPRSGVILVRSGGDLGAVVSLVQGQLRRLDPELPVGESFWVADAFRQSVARQRFQASLLSSFGMLGLLLAVLGVYGALSLSVTRRTREIGVRLALGASRTDVERRVLAQGLGAVGAGTALGLILSFWTSGLLADLLWGVEATDLLTYLVSAGAILGAGLAAAYLSTRRAVGIDPVEALKRE